MCVCVLALLIRVSGVSVCWPGVRLCAAVALGNGGRELISTLALLLLLLLPGS